MELRSGTVVPPPQPAEQDYYFRQGVNVTLRQWTAFQLACENEWGGRETRPKASTFEQEVVFWFYRGKPPLYVDELEDFLDDRLEQDFNTEVGDGSIQEVAVQLMALYNSCAQGNFQVVQELVAKAAAKPPATAASRPVAGEGMEDSDSDLDEADMAAAPAGAPCAPIAHGGGDAMDTADGPSGSTDRGAGASAGAEGAAVQAVDAGIVAQEEADGWTVIPVRKGRRGK